VHIIEGEGIDIPVSFLGNSNTIRRDQAFLVHQLDNIYVNSFDKIKIEKDKSGNFHHVKINGLKEGQYLLQLSLTSGVCQHVEIHVYSGTYWENDFILSNNSIVERSTYTYPIMF